MSDEWVTCQLTSGSSPRPLRTRGLGSEEVYHPDPTVPYPYAVLPLTSVYWLLEIAYACCP